MKTTYHIGCSGFHYRDWKEKFYPKDVPQKEWLGFYADRFDTVEINNSFYRMPKEGAVRNWYEKVPDDFQFTMKGSRYVTHLKKLKEPKEHVDNFYHMADGLKEKLGCILWQLPGNLHRNDEKLDNFCQALNSNYRNVIEFRHDSWFTDQVYSILKEHNVCVCIISAPDGLPEEALTTADIAYVRFHGKKEWYKYKYSSEELKKWSKRIKSLKAKEVYIYFNNDVGANAVKDAQELTSLLK